MQSLNAPNKISLPFAASGTKNTIPVLSQQGVTPGAASFTDGFPPLTFTPLSAGGVPPSGADFNGILNSITALQQWKSAGGQFPFDATFAAAIGGYPKGATVLKADGTGLWISTAENNSANPDTGGAGWLAFSASSIQAGSYNTAPDTGTTNAYAMTLSPAPAALTPGMVVHLNDARAGNSSASTLNVNGMGALPIWTYNNYPLSGGEINTASDATFMLNSSGSAWRMIYSSGSMTSWSGSNSNGSYLSTASGYLICSVTDFVLSYNQPIELSAWWTYPSTFAYPPAISGMISDNNDGRSYGNTLQLSTSQRPTTFSAFIGLMAPGTGQYVPNNSIRIDLIALGRWMP